MPHAQNNPAKCYGQNYFQRERISIILFPLMTFAGKKLYSKCICLQKVISLVEYQKRLIHFQLVVQGEKKLS